MIRWGEHELTLAKVRERARAAREALRQPLLVDGVRYPIALSRFAYFAYVRRRLKAYTDESGAVDNTVHHNLRGLQSLRTLAVGRSSHLLRPLSVIEALDKDTARVLSIGPRSEGEILNLVGHGFRRSNIRAVDLISYSPWIDLGNMHELPYADDSFDVALMGWVLAYSTEPKRAVAEVMRVVRSGGFVAISVAFDPKPASYWEERLGYGFGEFPLLETVDDILALFDGAADRIYFSHDIAPERRDRVGTVSVIFSLRA